jgi:hypothetical protein
MRARRVFFAPAASLDEVFRVDEFPRNDGKVEANAFFAVNGGCAANASAAGLCWPVRSAGR